MKSDSEPRPSVLYEPASEAMGARAKADGLETGTPDRNRKTDADIAAAAENKIGWAAMAPTDSLKVLVRDGWVTLEGEVDWQFQKESVGAAVRVIRGVVGVSNTIAVRPR